MAENRRLFAKAPRMNPDARLVTGVVCGIRVEEVEDPLLRKIRQLDKLVDELAQGKALERVLRQEAPAKARPPAAKPPAAKPRAVRRRSP